MIAARWAMLFLVSLGVLGALGASAIELSPSARQVMVAAVIGLFAPLFWPGNGATPMQTACRVAGWSAAVAGGALAAMRLLGPATPPWSHSLVTGAMLLVILLMTHLLAAGLEGLLRRPGEPTAKTGVAREAAGRMLAGALALLGALPLWLAPLGEVVSARHGWVIDVALAFSPLTHLAVASGNDLLRNEWFYQHSNLAVLPVSYPGLTELSGAYACLAAVLALAAFTWRRLGATRIDPTLEQIRS